MIKKNTSNRGIKELRTSFGRSVFLCFVAFFTLITASTAWFAKNSQAQSSVSGVTANGDNPNFELATVGRYEKGVYDSEAFSVTTSEDVINYGGVDYYIINGDNSIRLTTDNNVNNIYSGQEIRPGDKGKIELYVICKSELKNVSLLPTLELFVEENGSITENNNLVFENYTKAHIMTFFKKNDDGTYDKKVNYDEEFTVNLEDECDNVYTDENVSIYKMVYYWVWPEELHNLIYLNRTYNKNLFNSINSEAYIKINSELNDQELRKKYFFITDENDFPSINMNMETDDYLYATDLYNQVDEIVGSNISFVKFGLELK